MPQRFVAPLFALASLGAVAAGCRAASAHGVGASVWGRNLAAWAAGGVAAAALSRAPAGRGGLAALLAGLATMAATLAAPGLEGVHRWLQLGGVRLDAAEVVAPSMVVLFAVRPTPWRCAALLGAALVLALQPDASQAVALAGGVLVGTTGGRAGRIGSAATLAVVALAAAACLRPDPLAPVAEVEGIMRLAWEVSPVLAGLAALAVTLAVLAPVLGRSRDLAAGALSTCLGVAALAPAAGAFPAPWVGMGVSPMLGAWLGFGVWSGLRRARDEAPWRGAGGVTAPAGT